MISAQEALVRLQDGNRRFVAGLQSEGARPNHLRRALTADAQHIQIVPIFRIEQIFDRWSDAIDY